MKRLLVCGLGLVALLSPAAGLADGVSTCRALNDRREALASEAMSAEIALATRYRQQRCPELNSRAELANANSQVFAAINYEALLQCRQVAERRLERENPVLYRNRLGFTFYSPAGSTAAQQADQQLQDMQRQGCGS